MFLWKNANVLTFLLLLILASGCGKNDESYTCCNPDSDAFVMSYGTSFGMCAGYCKTSLTVTEDKLTFTKSGWSDTVKTIIVRKEVSTQKWDSLMLLLPVDRVSALPELIGCPDCADGGAEWIEVVNNDLNHKITFEYRNEPGEIAEYVQFLRKLTHDLNSTIE